MTDSLSMADYAFASSVHTQKKEQGFQIFIFKAELFADVYDSVFYISPSSRQC